MIKERDIVQEKQKAQSVILWWELDHQDKASKRLLEAFERVQRLEALGAYKAGLADGMALAQSLAAGNVPGTAQERAG